MEEKSVATLLLVVAHPDDESFGCGALIAATALEGTEVILCCASRGELGEDATGRYSSPEALGRAREQELRESAQILGARRVEFLDLTDSGWDGEAVPGSIIAERERLDGAIERALRAHHPEVVITMDPTGSDGHRDHAAVAAATTRAFTRAVQWPASLYHWCLPHSLMSDWTREIAAQDPASVYLETDLGRPDEDVTTVLDGREVLDRVQHAMVCHLTQTGPYQRISAELTERFIGYDHLVRVHPPWQGGRTETALLWPEPVSEPLPG